jgi:hypothetical protein
MRFFYEIQLVIAVDGHYITLVKIILPCPISLSVAETLGLTTTALCAENAYPEVIASTSSRITESLFMKPPFVFMRK